MSVIGTPLLLGEEATGYQISRSVRLRSSASAYFNRTPASAGNRTTWTWSGWVKRGALNSAQYVFSAGTSGSSFATIGFTSSNTLTVWSYIGGNIYELVTTQVFRDPSAWYHIAVAFDTTQATSSNRIKVYVNGSQVTSFGTISYPSLNLDTLVNSATTHTISQISGFGNHVDGYLTEVNFIDGQALTPSSFGETDTITGVWKPKRYAGTYGTNGFYLNFSDNSAATAAAIGKDSSGNGNNWTPNNISVTAGATYDSMLDTPTPYADGGNGRGNYCVLNPLKVSNAAPVSDGNLRFLGVSASFVESIYGTIGVTGSGKYYFEVTGAYLVGFNNSDVNAARDQTTGRVTYHGSSGFISVGATTVQSGLATAYNNTDVVGVALNLDAGTIAFYKNNTQLGTNVSISSASTWWPFIQNTTTYYSQVNFGQRPFAYTPPTGFKALNTQNLPDATIKKGADYFDVTTYTGDGSSTRAVPLSIAPDLLWLKNRTAANDHILIDTVRGGTAPAKTLFSNLTNAEFTTTGAFNNYGYVDSLSGSTLNVVKGTQTSSYTNYLNSAYVGWQWKESASAGFDIVTWTGDGTSSRNINHSLGVAPKMIISKSRTLGAGDAGYWDVYHASLAAQNTLFLHTTGAAVSAPTIWPSAPTSTYFTVGSGSGVNVSGSTMVAYLFAEVAGFSKFGSYTGNGSADGPFVYLGFRPKFVMIKCYDNAGLSWFILDESRNTYNVADARLFPDQSTAETTGQTNADILSNGFKVRTSGTSTNGSGYNYIYAAFAENPFKNSLAR